MTIENLQKLLEIEEQIKSLKNEAEAIKDEIKKEMGNEEHLEIGAYNINWTITIGEDWDYSVTTSKHRNIFFRDYAEMSELATKDGLKKAIKDGVCNNFKVVLQCS